MRLDENGIWHTLDEDIVRIFYEHGLNVLSENVNGNTWVIEAKVIKRKKGR